MPRLRVRALTWEAEGVLGVELRPLERDARLAPAPPGAHIELALPGGLLRSYSLLEPEHAPRSYRIAVQRDASSRGGSRWIHESLRPGDVLEASEPRDRFPLVEGAPWSVLVAGGIGITPIVSMARRLTAIGAHWSLHYAARTRERAAFVDELRALAARAHAPLHVHWDHESGGVPIDVAAVVAAAPADAQLYCCGPAPMIAAFEAAAALHAPGRGHVERFAADAPASTDGGFEVELARRGLTVHVPAGRSILDALLDTGVDPLYSCREGVCGTCEVRVLDGIPDHRDIVLSPAERAANTRMMICCSGAKSPTLRIDL